ncbi:MAG: TonB-dependent receptor plug domain-containing protein, partial [Nitrospinota bacterium]
VVSENEEIKVKYFISPLKFGSYETVVTASVNEKEVTRRKLSREEIRYLPGTQGDIIKVLQNLPGVSRGSFGDGRLVIRGTAPQDSKTYLNGIEIPAIFHFGGLRSVIATQMVEDVEYMGGGYSSRYGNSIGGVVDIKLKHQNPDHWRSWVGVDTFDAGFYTEGPVSEKASISLSGRRSYIDIILNALLKDNEDFSFTVAPRYYDSQIQFSYNPNKRNRFLLPVVFSNDELAFVIGNPPEDGAVIRGNIKNSTEFTMISPHYTYFSPSGWSNRISANIGRNMFFFNLTEDYKFDLDVKRYDIRNEISLPQVHKGTLILGVDSKTGDYEVEVSLPRPNNPAEVFTPITTREIIHQDVKGTSTIFSFYSQWERSFDRLSIVPGLRFSWFSSLSETTIEPRFSMKYKLSDPTTLKMAAGWFYRQPDDVEIDEVFGNPDLRTERSRQLVVGVERDLNKLGLLDLQLFYNALDHLAVEDDEKNYTSNGKGRIWGLELLHRFPEKGKVTGWLSYTLSRSERKDVRTGRYYVHNYDQTHIVSLLASYHLSASWKLGTRVRYVTGNPYTPVKNAFFDSDNDVYI